MSNIEVFLKCNRETLPSLICLDFWIKVFSDYKVTIICDLFDVTNSNPSSELKKVARHIPIINTDYSLSKPFGHLLKVERWHNVCSSNLTCFKATTSNNFWLIDADDTQFLTTDISMIKEKVKRAEDYLIDGNLDGLSLDFYREIKKDHWSFGMALFRGNLDLLPLANLTPDDLYKYKGLILNFDSVLDYARRSDMMNFQSFVFDNCFFQHQLEQPALPYGVYFWKDRKIWNTIDLRDDIVSF
jgi:hypothetical protein